MGSIVRHTLGRRGVMLGGGLALVAGGVRAQPALPVLRLGTVQSGSVQWVADVIRRGGLDRARGFRLETQVLATTEAAKVALLSRSVDVSVSDWPFVALQRMRGQRLTFAPFSASLGGIMVPKGSPVTGLRDLAGRRLGVAGGPADKSWLLVQAAARRAGVDLAQVRVDYAAPPLLSERLRVGEIDAALTFWTFCARLEAAGFREAVSVDDAARQLGLAPPILVGWVFDEGWARTQRGVIDGFLSAAAEAEGRLRSDPAEWAAVRPLMAAPDPRVFEALRQRFLAGIRAQDAGAQAREAEALVQVALRVGGPEAMGGVTQVPAGTFWAGRTG